MSSFIKNLFFFSTLASSSCYATSWIVGDSAPVTSDGNPVLGGSNEYFVTTQSLTGTELAIVENDTSTTVAFSAASLGYATYDSGTSSETYFVIAFDLNEQGSGNNTEFNLSELSIKIQGGAPLYSLGSDDVTFYPVGTDPFDIVNDPALPVQFHQGSSDIDVAIYIPASVLTANGVTATDTIEVTYFVSDLEGGPDKLNLASDGTTFTLVPEPSTSLFALIGSAFFLARRRRH
jgi:hypothetical protein